MLESGRGKHKTNPSRWAEFLWYHSPSIVLDTLQYPQPKTRNMLSKWCRRISRLCFCLSSSTKILKMWNNNAISKRTKPHNYLRLHNTLISSTFYVIFETFLRMCTIKVKLMKVETVFYFIELAHNWYLPLSAFGIVQYI